uniref:Uncharacterized protein n=1 Tax=Lepeophtheirus salmonis TaxID=72036 RepID=A0A0K2TSI7_LEPSM
MTVTSGFLLDKHTKGVVEGGWHQGCRGANESKKSSKEHKRLIQKMAFFLYWWHKWPLHRQKAHPTHFFL